MNYSAGQKVRIKSLDWYNKNKDNYGAIYAGNGFCFWKNMTRHCGEIMKITTVKVDPEDSNKGFYFMENSDEKWTDGMIEGLVEEETKPKLGTALNPIEPKSNANCLTMERVDETKPKDMGEVSDGYHTFNELYEYRMLYNAALFNEFAKQGLYDVHKSRKHSDGEYPFGDSNWFIVMAELPTGQISNHYEMKDWDKFQIPEKPLANKWDEHSLKDVANRLTSFTTPKKEYPKTYEECRDLIEGSHVEPFCADLVATGYLSKLMERFARLIMCRNAYWKLYGEEMGLGKPWEPDWGAKDNHFYTIYTFNGKIECSATAHRNAVLIFPTEEMRDAFYENFKELIEQCKELL